MVRTESLPPTQRPQNFILLCTPFHFIRRRPRCLGCAPNVVWHPWRAFSNPATSSSCRPHGPPRGGCFPLTLCVFRAWPWAKCPSHSCWGSRASLLPSPQPSPNSLQLWIGYNMCYSTLGSRFLPDLHLVTTLAPALLSCSHLCCWNWFPHPRRRSFCHTGLSVPDCLTLATFSHGHTLHTPPQSLLGSPHSSALVPNSSHPLAPRAWYHFLPSPDSSPYFLLIQLRSRPSSSPAHSPDKL